VVYIASALDAPTLSQVSGGSLAATTYYVKTTYVNAHGETTASPESSLAVSANYLLRVASPTSVPGATGWNVYISTTSGAEEQENNAWNGGAPVPIGTAYTISTGGTCYASCANPPPTHNATGFAAGESPIASVMTNSGGITSITDLRTWSADHNATQGPNLRVDLLPGANLGEKWANCISALPASGGGCDLTRLTGAQTIASNPFSGRFKPTYSTFGPAVVTTVPIAFPANVNQLINMVGTTSIRGVGNGGTIFVPSAANEPVFTGPANGTICYACYLGFVAVQPYASGSTGPAIDMGGFDFSTFEQIEYWPAPNWSGDFNSFFHASAYPNGACYANRILMPIVESNQGPANVFLFDTGGGGSYIYSPNVQLIDYPIITMNSGISVIFNLQRSSGVTVRGGLVDQNSGATILIPGIGTIFEEVWVEPTGGSVLVSPQTASDGESAQVTIRNNLFWGTWSFTIPSWSSDWTITGNEPAVNLTVTDNGTNDLIQYGATVARQRLKPVTFSSLSACASGLEGTIAAVTNSTTNNWGATITNGGTDHVLAYCDGTKWTVAAP